MSKKFIDLSGQRFGKITVLYRTDDYISPDGARHIRWRCKCDCGRECDKIYSYLKQTKGGCSYCRNHSVLAGFNDLKTTHPELLDEWDYTKNIINPTEVVAGTNKKIWWKCKLGHSYEMKISSRTGKRKCGCPYCSGLKHIKGVNDLETTHPELLNEWDYIKNGELKPKDFAVYSQKKVWWQCSQGHSYQMKVRDRTYNHNNCPICSKEMRTSFPEQAIYYYVKKFFNDAENSNKNVIGMELDVYIPSKKIAIEYDGVRWHQNNTSENKKNILCKINNIKLIRIREIGLKKLDDCICIFRKQLQKNQSLSEVIVQIFNFIDEKIKIDVDVDRDITKIYNFYVHTFKKISLFSEFPELAKEWNYKKNGDLLPTQVAPRSALKVWWKCSKCNHEFQSVIFTRSFYNCDCPVCARKKVALKLSQKIAMISSKSNVVLKIFDSIGEAAKHFGVANGTIRYKCKNAKPSKGDFYLKYV